MTKMTDNAKKTYTVKIVERGHSGRTYTETVDVEWGAVFAPLAAIEKIYQCYTEGGTRHLKFSRIPEWNEGPDGVTKTYGEVMRTGLTGGYDVLEMVDVTVTEHR